MDVLASKADRLGGPPQRREPKQRGFSGPGHMEFTNVNNLP